MSFLSDLFEGNFSNLGTDLSHAPSSFVQDWSSEEPWVLGGAAVAGGLLLGPEVIGALGAGDAAAAGGAAAATDVGAAAATDLGATAGLDAASSTFGAFDPAVFGAESGDVAAGIGTAETAAGTLGADATAALDAGAAGTDLLGASEAPVAAATDFAPSGDAAAFAPEAIPGSPDPTALLSDISGTADSGVVDSTVPSDLMSLQAPGDAGGGAVSTGAQPQTLDQLLSQTNDTLSTQAPSSIDQLETGTSGTTANATAGFLDKGGALDSALSSPLTKLGLAAAPIGLALLRGESSLPAQDATATANANQLAAFGQQQLAMGQAGQLNAAQMAYITNMQNNLTNQALQTMYNMGVTDPTRDSRWPQMQANIQLQVSAQTQAFIQQEIQNGLSALGSSSGTLTAISQQQMAADTAFTNTLVSAVSAGARVLSTAGTKTTTTTTTA